MKNLTAVVESFDGDSMGELDKLILSKKQAASIGPAAVRLNEIKVQRKLEEEKAENGGDEETNGTITPEKGVVPEEAPDGEAQKELKAEEAPEETAALESFETALDTTMHYGGKLLGGIVDGLIYLFRLGVRQTPMILENLYRGVLYISVKTAKFLHTSYLTVEKYRDRHQKSFSKLTNEIKTLREVVKTLQKKQKTDLTDHVYTRQNVINALKVGNSVDFTANMKIYQDFLSKAISDIHKGMKTDLSFVVHMLKSGGSHQVNPDTLPKIKMAGWSEGVVYGYEFNPELVDGFHFPKKLPGDTVFMAMVPRDQLNSIDSFSKAVSASSLFFGIDKQNFVSVDSIKVASLDELLKFLDKLEDVCKQGLQHESFYREVSEMKSSLKRSFRTYFERLVHNENKVRLKDSLGQNIHLTLLFTDQVYLAGAMDVHDFTIRLVHQGITYVKDQTSFY